MIDIKEVKGKSGVKKFVNVAWKIYKEDPNWVPPLKSDLIGTLMGKNNPLFMSGEHAFFIAYKGKKPAGRICVGINENLNQRKNYNYGYICLFESIPDKDVAFSLFDRAQEWLKNRGITCVRGPVSPTNGDDYKGLLIKGFDTPPVLMNSYNPPYYRDYFEEYGFEKEIDLFAYYFDLKQVDLERYERAVKYAMKKYNFRVDPIDLKNLDREAEDIKKILDVSMPQEWEDLTPPTLDEIKAEMKNLKPFADPDLIYIARSGERPVGFAIALPDYNIVLKRLNGRLFPFGIFKFMWYRRKINGGRIFILFVIPEFRKKGVSGAIFYKCFEAGKRKGYIYGEGSTIGEPNIAMRRDAEKAGGKHYKTYRIYRKEIK